ncbi:hypothetical protein [Williamsia herbipolensis]|uniref:hypothetical protein n=1 Tax=Williamsia herbipolensis TaxID=1603258 RepID=UPI0005F78CBF|nr:hypothetical protein [Williamsia herbipolensis]
MEIWIETRTVWRALAFVGAVAGWTLLAYPCVVIGVFLAADSSCDGGELHASASGVWWVIATIAVWASPFLVFAGYRRTRLTIAVALLAVIVAVVVVAAVACNPGEFCF